jgi:hypothetical protein
VGASEISKKLRILAIYPEKQEWLLYLVCVTFEDLLFSG